MKPYKKFLLICAGIATLAACSKPEATVEEKVLMAAFANFTAAQTYDKECDGGKITSVPPTKDLNIYWYGNQQTIASMIAAPMKRRYPEDDVETSVKRLLKTQDKISEKTQKILAEKGCHSPEAVHMAKALRMFTEVPPWALQGMLADQVKKQGGSMTELSPEESAVSQKENSVKGSE